MSDGNACTCTLILSGTVLADNAIALLDALDTIDCIGAPNTEIDEDDPDRRDAFAVLMGLRDEDGTLFIEFDEVSDGCMTEQLEDTLEALHLPYVWTMGMSDCEGPRSMISQGGHAGYLCLHHNTNGQLLMPIDALDTPGEIARHQAYRQLYRAICTGTFIAAPTAHAALALHTPAQS